MVSLGLVKYMGLWVTGTGGLNAGLLLPAGTLMEMLLLLLPGTLGAMMVADWPMSPPLIPPATKAFLSLLV